LVLLSTADKNFGFSFHILKQTSAEVVSSHFAMIKNLMSSFSKLIVYELTRFAIAFMRPKKTTNIRSLCYAFLTRVFLNGFLLSVVPQTSHTLSL